MKLFPFSIIAISMFFDFSVFGTSISNGREAQKYLFKPDQLHKLQKCIDVENFEQRGRSLLVVVSTPPTKDYENFTKQVREYNTKEPFNFTMPPLFNNYIKVNMPIQSSYGFHEDILNLNHIFAFVIMKFKLISSFKCEKLIEKS